MLLCLDQSVVLWEFDDAVVVEADCASRYRHEVLELIAFLEVTTTPELESIVKHRLAGMKPAGCRSVICDNEGLLAALVPASGSSVRRMAC